MMGRQSGQMSMIILDMVELIPENHLLQKINQMVSFDFIYDFVAPHYPANGRPSVDPVSMVKMLLVGYLYGIKSERCLVQGTQLNITGHIPTIRFPNDPNKYGFSYDPQKDTFICPMGQSLSYHRLNCNKSTGKYLRCYQVQGDACRQCSFRKTCFDTTGVRRRILASSCYPTFYRGHLRVDTLEYWHMMKKRKIWAEGSFAAMKREHIFQKFINEAFSLPQRNASRLPRH